MTEGPSEPVEAQDQPQPKDEWWLYAGRRLTSKGEIDAWVPGEDGEAEELWYAVDKRSFMVGALYRVEVTRRVEKNRITKHGTPHFERSRVAPPDKLLEWSVLDGVTRTRVAADKAEQRAKRADTDPIREAVAPLKALGDRLFIPADRDAFLARVIRELTRGWR